MTVALVLGAAVWPGGEASPTLSLRVRHAVDLYHAGQVTAICISGGLGAHGPSEAEVGATLARRLGVPADALIEERLARNTVENIALSLPLIVGARVIVTSRWHIPRAWLAARLLGVSAPVVGPRGGMAAHRVARAVLREAVALPATALRALRWARRTGP